VVPVVAPKPLPEVVAAPVVHPVALPATARIVHPPINWWTPDWIVQLGFQRGQELSHFTGSM